MADRSEAAQITLRVLGILVLSLMSVQLVTSLCRCAGLRKMFHIEFVPTPWARDKLGTPNVTLWGQERGYFGEGGRLTGKHVLKQTQGVRLPDSKVLKQSQFDSQGARLPDDRVLVDTKFVKAQGARPEIKGCGTSDPHCKRPLAPKACNLNDISSCGAHQSRPAQGCGACQAGLSPQGCGSCQAQPVGAPHSVRPRACPTNDPSCRKVQGVRMKGKLGAALSPSVPTGRTLPKVGSSQKVLVTGLAGREKIIHYDTNSLNRMKPEGNIIASRMKKGLL